MKAIINVQVVREHGILWDGAVLLKGDRIAWVGPQRELTLPTDAAVIDGKGAYLGPGFVDLHVHAGGGFSTCLEPEQAARFFLRHGETSLLATPAYQMDGKAMLQAIRNVKQAMKRAKNLKGLYMEGPYVNPAYGAFANQNPWRGPIRPEDYLPLVEEGGEAVKVWAVAPEREDLLPFLQCARRVNPNVVFAVGHSEATPMQIRALGAYRPTLMTHVMNATGKFSAFGGTPSYGPDEYCLRTEEMTAELISDSCGIHVHPEMQQLLLHCKGVDKVVLITDSTVFDLPTPPQFAHVTDLNFDDTGGIAGSKMTMDQACRNVMANTDCGIVQAFRMASANPARVIGLDHLLGSVTVGKQADLVLTDDRFHIQEVFLQGELCRFEKENQE